MGLCSSKTLFTKTGSKDHGPQVDGFYFQLLFASIVLNKMLIGILPTWNLCLAIPKKEKTRCRNYKNKDRGRKILDYKVKEGWIPGRDLRDLRGPEARFIPCRIKKVILTSLGYSVWGADKWLHKAPSLVTQTPSIDPTTTTATNFLLFHANTISTKPPWCCQHQQGLNLEWMSK